MQELWPGARRRIDDTLELRALTSEDAAAWYAVLEANRDFLATWIRTPRRVGSLADARAYVERFETERERGTAHTFGIWQSGRLVGEILLFSIRPEDGSGELGYWLAESAQGHGIMGRACRSMLELAFEDLALNRVEIRCPTENLRSQAVARRLGGVQEGRLRQVQRLNDRLVDHVVFGVLASEWRMGST